MKEGVKFHFSTDCTRHRQPLDFMCTYPGCSQLELCTKCFDEHTAIHAKTYIYSQKDWLKKLDSDLDTISKDLNGINLESLEEDCSDSVLFKSSKCNSQDLTSSVEKLMKCLTEERSHACQKIYEEVGTLDKQYSKLSEKNHSFDYFQEMNSNRSIEWVFFLLSEKGWKKMKGTLHKMYHLTAGYKQYITKSSILRMELDSYKGGHKQIPTEMQLLGNIEKLIEWKISYKKRLQPQEKQRKVSNIIPKACIKPEEKERIALRNESPQKRKRARSIFGKKL